MISAVEYIKNVLDEKSGNNQEAKFFLMVPRGNKKKFKRRHYQSMDDYILKTISVGNLLIK